MSKSIKIVFSIAAVMLAVSINCKRKDNARHISRSDYSILKSKVSSDGRWKAIAIVHAYGPQMGGASAVQEVRIYPGSTPDDRLEAGDNNLVFSADLFNEKITDLRWDDNGLHVSYFKGLTIRSEKVNYQGIQIHKEEVR